MTKLTDRKIRWIIREKMKENLSTNDIALLQNVSESRIDKFMLVSKDPIIKQGERRAR